MSKLECVCGGTISDAAFPSPTEAILIAQQDDEHIQTEVLPIVGAFIRALLAGRRNQWIRSFFGEQYPVDAQDEIVLSDIQTQAQSGRHRLVSECSQCGRLWVQIRAGENHYKSYVPDEGGCAEILRGGRATG